MLNCWRKLYCGIIFWINDLKEQLIVLFKDEVLEICNGLIVVVVDVDVNSDNKWWNKSEYVLCVEQQNGQRIKNEIWEGIPSFFW